MEGDKEVKEAFREYEREQEKSKGVKSAVTKVSNRTIFLVFLLIGGFYYMSFMKNWLDPKIFYWVLVGIISMIYITAFKAQEETGLIPEDKLKAILYNKLKWKQAHSPSEIPQGRIEIMLPCKLKKIEGTPVKYVIGFRIVESNGLESTWVAEVNPKDGYMLGFEERPEGFKGTEITDVAFIRPKEDIWQERYFSGKRGKK